MSVKHSIEEIFDLNNPYISSESVIEHKEELKMSLKELEEDRDMSDIVNQPPHYISDDGIETIDVIEAFTKDLEPFEAYCTGNIIKYVCRWNHKNGLEDLRKAKWYINKILGDDKHKVEIPRCDLDILKRHDPYNIRLWTEVDGIFDLRQFDNRLHVRLDTNEVCGEHIIKLPNGSKVRVTIEKDV